MKTNSPTGDHQASQPSESTRKIIAAVLLCCGAVICLLLTLFAGSVLSGLLLASPFLLCGVICLVCGKNTGLWCAWGAFFCLNVYWRYATGITWRLTLWTLNFDPAMNYLRLAFAWAELLCFVILIVVTVRRFWKTTPELSARGLVLLAAGWVVFVLLCIPLPLDPLSAFGNLHYILGDWVRIALLTPLLVFTLGLIRQRKQKGPLV